MQLLMRIPFLLSKDQARTSDKILSHSAVWSKNTQPRLFQAVASLWLAGHFLLNVQDLEANLLRPDMPSFTKPNAFCNLWQAQRLR